MISAVAPNMSPMRSNYNVNLGQLRPQNQVLKNYQTQQLSKNPAFGDDGGLDDVMGCGCAVMGIGALIVAIYGGLCAATAINTRVNAPEMPKAYNICYDVLHSDLANSDAGFSDPCVKACGAFPYDGPAFPSKQEAINVLKQCREFMSRPPIR